MLLGEQFSYCLFSFDCVAGQASAGDGEATEEVPGTTLSDFTSKAPQPLSSTLVYRTRVFQRNVSRRWQNNMLQIYRCTLYIVVGFVHAVTFYMCPQTSAV